MAVDAPAPDKRHRSKLTNHRGLLPDLDGRSQGARRFRDIVSQIALDLGGLDSLSEAKVQLCKRFAAASVLSERMESKLANGGAIDITEHGQLCSTLVRIANHIGVERVPKDIAATHAWAGATREIIDESIAYGHLDEHGKVVVDGTKDPLA